MTPVLKDGPYNLGILTLKAMFGVEYDKPPKELLFPFAPIRDVKGNISPCAPEPVVVKTYHELHEGYLYYFNGTNAFGNPIYVYEKPQSIIEISDKHLWDQPAGLIIKDPLGALWSNQAGEGLCAHPVERGRYVDLEKPNPFHDGYCLDEMYNLYAGSLGGMKMSNDVIKEIDTDLNKIGLRLDQELIPWSMEAWLHVIMKDGAKAVLTYGNCD